MESLVKTQITSLSELKMGESYILKGSFFASKELPMVYVGAKPHKGAVYSHIFEGVGCHPQQLTEYKALDVLKDIDDLFDSQVFHLTYE